MSVTSATGFPVPTGSQYFYCTLADAATQTTIEIVKVTAVSGTTFTIVRGQDGTAGTAFSSGAVVSLRLVAASLNDFPKLDEVNTFSQAQTFSVAPITSTLTGFVYGNGASAQTVATNAQLLTLLGTLPVANGGTGLTSLTAGYIPYGNGTGAFSSSSGLSFDGTNLLVGTTSTSGSISNNAVISAGKFSSANGSISVANATAGTIFTLPGTTLGSYIVTADINSSAPLNYSAVALVTTDGGVARLTTLQAATNNTISISGLNVQVTQTSGATNTVLWSVIRLS